MSDLIYLFCVYSFLGWIVEVVFFYFKTKKFQKRGILHGPYCPLYGFSLAACTLCISHINNVFISIILCGIICTAFEFITGVILDKVLHRPMWDYSNCRFNIRGYICLTFAIIWSISAYLCVVLLNPILLNTFETVKIAASVSVITVMSSDALTKVKQ